MKHLIDHPGVVEEIVLTDSGNFIVVRGERATYCVQEDLNFNGAFRVGQTVVVLEDTETNTWQVSPWMRD